MDANTARLHRLSSRRSRRAIARVRCHRSGCRAPGVVVVEAPCCAKPVLVCVQCSWEALQPSDLYEEAV